MLECFQKVVERFRKMITIQHCIILDTFNRQSTKPKQDSILCVSNFPMNNLKFWCFDSNCSWPLAISQILCFPFIHHFLTHFVTRQVSSACNWKQTYQSPGSKCGKQSFVIASFFFFYCVKLELWGNEFHEFYFLKKTLGLFLSGEALIHLANEF